MSGLFGILFRDGRPVEPSILQAMRKKMAAWGPDRTHTWHDQSAGLGHVLFRTTIESCFEKWPHVDMAKRMVFACAARVDNRRELGNALGIASADMSRISDGELVRQAYCHWGEQSTRHIYGDWSFAAWHPDKQKFFLARDHLGITALYYYADQHTFAFSSSRQALLDLNLSAVKMDELYLAQVLVSWPAYHGERTVHTPICRLPPAHTISVTPERLDVRQYWYLEDTPELKLSNRLEYVDAFREVFDSAVQSRLRAEGPVAVSLSGGLDSGSVTATAARFLRVDGHRLSAYTSIPTSDTGKFVGENFGDEFSLAKATADFAGNVDLYPVTAIGLTPVQAIRRVLSITNEPSHAACNYYWMLELHETVRRHGCKVLLNGQAGNAGVSWTGDIFSQPLAYLLKQIGWRNYLKRKVKRTMPFDLIAMYRHFPLKKQEWVRSSAIHPDFASRLNLFERRFDDRNGKYPRTPMDQRSFLMPGRSMGGALQAELAAAYGLELRDPTADARVLAFTFSVPDHIFIDPETATDRWLIRAAMKDRLPDEVRLNRQRGRQAGDLVPRLRSCAGEMEAALDELSFGPAAAYLDVAYMRQVWQTIQANDTSEAFRKSVCVLTRGIMAGLFVNGFYE